VIFIVSCLCKAIYLIGLEFVIYCLISSYQDKYQFLLVIILANKKTAN